MSVEEFGRRSASAVMLAFASSSLIAIAFGEDLVLCVVLTTFIAVPTLALIPMLWALIAPVVRWLKRGKARHD